MTDETKATIAQTLPPGGTRMYQEYGVEEDTARSAYHYEQDPEFYYLQTAGEWNVYSCLMWEDGFSVTQAQEKKLDKLAECMQLKPGMHILDVGCGWGGPLVYLCNTYGVTGHGITVSPKQAQAAQARAARYGVDATFEVVHWKNLPEVETYDAIYSDEVIVHFFDLGGFFARCWKLLRTNGLMAHKELHWRHASYADVTPLGDHIQKVFGFTGNYIPLHKELRLLEENVFKLEGVFEISMDDYQKTIDMWLKNVFDHRERMKALAGESFYKEYRAYLKAARRFMASEVYLLDIVTSRKIAETLRR
ncbi:MAG TPA: class I SAM-dependent methyltransferase [Anaerolineae bacterium]|nr:class I SAM-dependent methyltransferase [Anaerolineae bacterium]